MNNEVQKLTSESKHDFASLCEIMVLLRSENGCPWDREQTHESIRANFIEETYEVVEAIDNADNTLLQEELGDVLLQVVFHARIAEEEGAFAIDDVIHEVADKLIRRHPHIFAESDAKTSDQVLEKWESIKTEEKQRVGLRGTLEAIPPALPALMRAQKIVKKASRAAYTPDTEIAYERCGIASEVRMDSSDIEKKLEQTLLAVAVVAQQNGLDAEAILGRACRRVTEQLSSADEQNTASTASMTEEIPQKTANDVFFAL